FEKGQVSFFRQLAKRQDREWFREHKDEYLSLCEAPLRELLDDLHPALARQYRGRAIDRPKIFRIYRDVRFSKDKSPFKTGSSAVMVLKGGQEEGTPAALYLHLGLQDYAGAGHWMLPADKLARYRKLVADEKTGSELQRHIDRLGKKGFKIDSF